MTPISMSRRMSWLTARERTVLGHLMDGRSAGEIAALEFVSLCTVRSQIRAILLKLGVRTQPAAIAAAYQLMWPTDDDRREAFARVLGVAS